MSVFTFGSHSMHLICNIVYCISLMPKFSSREILFFIVLFCVGRTFVLATKNLCIFRWYSKYSECQHSTTKMKQRQIFVLSLFVWSGKLSSYLKIWFQMHKNSLYSILMGKKTIVWAAYLSSVLSIFMTVLVFIFHALKFSMQQYARNFWNANKSVHFMQRNTRLLVMKFYCIV